MSAMAQKEKKSLFFAINSSHKHTLALQFWRDQLWNAFVPLRHKLLFQFVKESGTVCIGLWRCEQPQQLMPNGGLECWTHAPADSLVQIASRIGVGAGPSRVVGVGVLTAGLHILTLPKRVQVTERFAVPWLQTCHLFIYRDGRLWFSAVSRLALGAVQRKWVDGRGPQTCTQAQAYDNTYAVV